MEKPSIHQHQLLMKNKLTSRPQTSRARAASLPEVDLYIHLIVLLYLIDRNSLKSVRNIIHLIFKKFYLFNLRLLIVLNVC